MIRIGRYIRGVMGAGKSKDASSSPSALKLAVWLLLVSVRGLGWIFVSSGIFKCRLKYMFK